MRVHPVLRLSLVAVVFVVLGLVWSWVAGGVVALAALLLLLSGRGTSGTGRHSSSPNSDGTAAAFLIWDTTGGCGSDSGSDGGGCGGGE
ncbi:hypothetical protein L1280_000978 [Deinococcus sp. HSC-46F16]|uniref:hypothetical protein n=1 Tax=Deinococcus sp. HSC-46F16 TaxID=2910968 RepID=UPI00209D6171|nr:hypothetical protein [Deinococcus sp. HSC-46F16]MCP2013850.1 hypothetical protein [Deinococcus sp. HSC-46F16]